MGTEVREVPGCGLCVFAAEDFAAGDIVLREPFLFESLPEDRPAIATLLEELHAKEPFAFGHTRSHYAAVSSWLAATPAAYTVLLEKYVPKDDSKGLTLKEVQQILTELDRACLLPQEEREGRELELSAEVLHALIQAWEYNGFTGQNGTSLVMYDKISRTSHSCAPNCNVVELYSSHRISSGAQDTNTHILRKGDKFEQRLAGLAFRAKTALKCGDELTFNYCLTEEDLAENFQHRREVLKLRGWNFLCHCDRCTTEIHEFLESQKPPVAAGESVDDEVVEGLLGLFDDH